MTMASEQLYPIIIINLSILLVASWCFSYFAMRKIVRDNKQLKKNKPQKNDKPNTETADAITDTFDQLKDQFEEKLTQLSTLEELQNQQKISLDMWKSDNDGDDNEAYDDLLKQHEKSELIIQQLQKDIEKSRLTIESLENKMTDSDLKSERISILEQSQKRLKRQANADQKNKAQIAQLADGLKKAKGKNQTLMRDNYQLKENIKKLSSASDKQLALIKKISDELEKATQLEQYQNQTIAELKQRLNTEQQHDKGSDKAKELEQELQDMNDKLERTLREKEFIESHLIEMDKTLEESKQVETAIDQSSTKIAAIEESYPDFEVDTAALAEPVKQWHINDPLPKMALDTGTYPELGDIVNHNRLFGIVHEYWNSYETPPMHLIAEGDITRPDDLEHWITTPLGHNQFSIVIGMHVNIAKTLKQFASQKPENKDITLEETLIKASQKIAKTLIEELNGDYTLEKSRYTNRQGVSEILKSASVATESLQESKSHSIYAALIQTT